MFSEPGETPDHPVEPSGQGERERQRHTEREMCDSSPSKRQIPPVFCSLDAPWKMKSFVKVNHKNATVPHMVFLFAPPQLLVCCLAGSQSQIIFWWWVECRITCSYKTTNRSCILYAYARASDKDAALLPRSSTVGK